MRSTIQRNLLVLSVFFMLASSLDAAAFRVWDGGAGDGLVSNPVNWDGNTAIPISNTDTLQAGANTVGSSPFIGFNTGEFRTPSLTFLGSATSPYTVTANTANDFLTLTGTGVALLNSSPVRQKFALITMGVGAATQTWDGGAQGLVLAQIDLGTNRTLTIDGTGTSSTTRNEIVGGITGTVTSGVTKAGSGTLVLNNNGDFENDYTGATTLLSGRLQLGRADQIPDASKLVLSGGTFDTGGFSDTLAELLLGGSATIDFGLSDNVSLIFDDSHLEPWSGGTLDILNFTLGADILRIGDNADALTDAQLAMITFGGRTAMISTLGFLEPIPEPGVSTAILFGLGLFGGYRRHRSDRSAT